MHAMESILPPSLDSRAPAKWLGAATMSTEVQVERTHGVEWCVASRASPGETVSGDLHLVKSWADGVLFAVVDGLGHGEEATIAARRAVETLTAHAEESVLALMQRCHVALRQTRGAVITLVSLNTSDRTAAMLGVGNVEAVLLHTNVRAPVRRESVLLRGGVVGYQLPALQASHAEIAPGDVLVFATDGVREDFGDVVRGTDSVAQIVETVMSRKFRGTDDGLVLAGKYVGTP
jgi:negative regulator of sigma-B (phosphoserine phosphatase)